MGVKKNMERRTDGQVVSTQARTSSYENHPNEMVRMMISRADVEERTDTPCHVCIKNPDILQVPSFEQQIRELDAAINENTPSMDLATNQEISLGREKIMQVSEVAMLKKNVRSHALGPSVATQAQSSKFGPQSIALKPMQEQKDNVSLFQPGINFNLGLSSPKHNKAQSMKKTKGGNQRKIKENREVPGTKKKLDREEAQPQEDNNTVDGSMGIEMVDMGTKRRARVPLAKLENKDDNGKRVKMDGEIKELGKLFAQ